jgi:hypothetical protein
VFDKSLVNFYKYHKEHISPASYWGEIPPIPCGKDNAAPIKNRLKAGRKRIYGNWYDIC